MQKFSVSQLKKISGGDPYKPTKRIDWVKKGGLRLPVIVDEYSVVLTTGELAVGRVLPGSDTFTYLKIGDKVLIDL